MVMGERARGEDRRRREITHHPMSRRPLETQNSPSSTRVEAPTNNKQKQQKIWTNLASTCQLDWVSRKGN